MKIYKTKSSLLSGTDFHEVHKKAFGVYRKIRCKSKRIPYVRSAYFKKDKVFLNIFWQHLWEKGKWQDRTRRLKYYEVAIELVCYSKFAPISKQNPNKTDEILHRFAGITSEGSMFYVQIKEDKRSGRKDLISIFPSK